MLAAHWHRDDRAKVCIICGEEKPLSEFYAYGYTTRQGKRSTRYESRCNICARQRRKATYHSDPQGEAEKHRAWRERNIERVKAYSAEKQKDPEHRAMKAKAQRMRKARIRARTDHQDDAIRAIYAEAMEAEKIIAPCPVFDLPELGKKVHVDHVIPLAAGGRHVAANLQLLPAGINMRKGTKCQQ